MSNAGPSAHKTGLNDVTGARPTVPAWLGHLIQWEPFWIVLVGIPLTLPGRFVPLRLHPVLLLLLFLGWPLRWLAYGRLSLRTPLDWSVGFVLLWLPVNFWASVDKTLSWEALGYLLFGLALYFALINWPPARRHPAWVAGMLLLIGAGMALFSPPLVAWKSSTRLFNLSRLYAFFRTIPIDLGETIHANLLAGALVLALPLFVALVLRWGESRRRWLPLVGAVGSGVILAMLLLSQSRGGLLGAAVAVGLVLVLRWPRLFYLTPLVLVVLAAAIYWLGPQRVWEEVAYSDSLGGWSFRLEVWRNSLYALSDFAFTGIGIGTFSVVLPLLYPFSFDPSTAPHAHNLFLQIGVDLGLPGLIAYLALLLNVFWMLIFVIRHRERSTLDWSLAVGTLGAVIALLVHGLLDAVTWGTKLAFLPWLLFALATLLYLKLQEELHPNEQVEKPSW